jgi:hypothetical protein
MFCSAQPVYVFAAIFTLVIAVFADRTQKRALFVLIPYGTAIVGLIICLATPQPRLPGLVLFAVYLLAAGVGPIILSIVI